MIPMSQLSPQPSAVRAAWCALFVGTQREADEAAWGVARREDVAVRIVRGSRCRGKSALLNEWGAALQFPYYYGRNWDAFEECLGDLSWLPASRCVFFIDDFDQVLRGKDGEFQTLMDILRSASRAGKSPVFVFHCTESRLGKARERLSAAGVRADCDLASFEHDWLVTAVYQ